MNLVYVKGLKGPEPQLWPEAPKNGSGMSKPPLQSTELTAEEAALPLRDLERIHPYKGAPDGP